MIDWCVFLGVAKCVSWSGFLGMFFDRDGFVFLW